MPRRTAPDSIRRAVRALRVAHDRSSERWIERIEDPAQRAPGRR